MWWGRGGGLRGDSIREAKHAECGLEARLGRELASGLGLGGRLIQGLAGAWRGLAAGAGRKEEGDRGERRG